MDKGILVLRDGKGYNKGQLIESYVSTKKGIVSGKNYIPKGDFVYLTEKLSKTDEEEVRKIIKEKFKIKQGRKFKLIVFFKLPKTN